MTILQEKVGLTNEDLIKIRSMRSGMPIDLQLTMASNSKRVRTEFVGMQGTRCLIFRYPDESKWGAVEDGVLKDKTIIARYPLEDDNGEILAFKVNVIEVATQPSDLIYTSFPISIQSHDLRSEPRAQTRIATSMFDAQTDSVICDSMILDISVQGCRMSIDKKVSDNLPKLRQVVKMYLGASKDKNIFIIGTVLHSKSDQVSLYYGVKFETPVKEVIQLLQAFKSVNA